MALTPERKDALFAELDALVGLKPSQPPKPRVVVSNDRPVRDADVRVSPADPNARNAVNGVVRVRRPDVVTINMAAAEAQWWDRERDRERDRVQRRTLDPCNLGIWGRWDD